MIEFKYNQFGSSIDVFHDGTSIGLIIEHNDMKSKTPVWIFKVMSSNYTNNNVLLSWSLTDVKNQIRDHYNDSYIEADFPVGII